MKRRAGAAAFFLVGLLAATTPAPIAHACSYFAPGLVNRAVWPERDVPLNGTLVISYQGYFYPWGPAAPRLGDDLVLLDAMGTPVETTFEVRLQDVLLRPRSALAPGATYQIADRQIVPCKGTCPPAQVPTMFASFTTAAAPDEQPPVFTGLQSIDAGAYQNESTSCGDFSGFSVTMTWPSGHDDQVGADVRYNLYHRPKAAGDWRRVLSLSRATMYRAVVNCPAMPPNPSRWPAAAPGLYQVRAVDAAGNEDPNSATLALPDLCATLAGPEPGPGGCRFVDRPGGPPGVPVPVLVAGAATMIGLSRRRRG